MWWAIGYLIIGLALGELFLVGVRQKPWVWPERRRKWTYTLLVLIWPLPVLITIVVLILADKSGRKRK